MTGWKLPPVDQIGYVVADIEGAIARLEPLFGPFTRLTAPISGVDYRGQPCDCTLEIAFGRSGDVEIELIQPIDGRSPHADFLAAGHEGMHHIRFRVDDLDAEIETAARFGYVPVWRHRMPGAAFAYLEHEDQAAVLVELLEMNDQEKTAPVTTCP